MKTLWFAICTRKVLEKTWHVWFLKIILQDAFLTYESRCIHKYDVILILAYLSLGLQRSTLPLRLNPNLIILPKRSLTKNYIIINKADYL